MKRASITNNHKYSSRRTMSDVSKQPPATFYNVALKSVGSLNDEPFLFDPRLHKTCMLLTKTIAAIQQRNVTLTRTRKPRGRAMTTANGVGQGTSGTSADVPYVGL